MAADCSPRGDEIVGLAALSLAVCCRMPVLLGRRERLAVPREERAER